MAGGKGRRMESEVPKQFLQLLDKPILMHTIEKFQTFSREIEIVLVLPEQFIGLWKSLIDPYNFSVVHQVVKGGECRFESVKNGLQVIPTNGLVAIHDGVRPLVSIETLEKVYSSSEKLGNAIPVIPVNESLRSVGKQGSSPVDRTQYKIVQTPQCFHSDIIKKAYEQEFKEEYTDDAMVAEAMGIKINLVEGNSENIKITRLSDILFAESLLA